MDIEEPTQQDIDDAEQLAANAERECTHVHEPAYWPLSGTGTAVCDCGATIRMEAGATKGDWHACSLCSNEVKA